MATDRFYSLDEVDTLQSQLKDFSITPRTQFSKKQVVESLIEEIEAALKNHPYEQVSKKLKEWNFDISASSLRQYVSAYRRGHKEEPDIEPQSMPEKKAGRKQKQTAQKRARSSKKQPTDSELDSLAHQADLTVDETQLKQNSEQEGQLPLDEPAPKVKKIGKGRLQSQDNSARYSGNNGKPLEVEANR